MLNHLKIHTLRNLDQVEIDLDASFNVFYGANGSGKSSLLEAIYFLGLGRSFRTRHVNRVIQTDAAQFSVYAELQAHAQAARLPVGVVRNRQGDTKLQVAHERIHTVAAIANRLPLQLICPDGHLLLTAGPHMRRQFIDWGLFHVEQSFFSSWKKYQRALKQRNAALRQHASSKHLAVWDDEFLSAAAAIDQQRQAYLAEFWPIADTITPKVLAEYQITSKYAPGWDQQQSLAKVLQADRQRDLELGFTQHGPHRADLRLYANGVPVKEILSQGQQKLLVYALKLAQGLYLQRATEKSCIYLVDDLTSELDDAKVSAILGVLAQLKAQVLLTCVEVARLVGIGTVKTAKMFHVEHGEVMAA